MSSGATRGHWCSGLHAPYKLKTVEVLRLGSVLCSHLVTVETVVMLRLAAPQALLARLEGLEGLGTTTRWEVLGEVPQRPPRACATSSAACPSGVRSCWSFPLVCLFLPASASLCLASASAASPEPPVLAPRASRPNSAESQPRPGTAPGDCSPLCGSQSRRAESSPSLGWTCSEGRASRSGRCSLPRARGSYMYPQTQCRQEQKSFTLSQVVGSNGYESHRDGEGHQSAVVHPA